MKKQKKLKLAYTSQIKKYSLLKCFENFFHHPSLYKYKHIH